MGKVTDEGKLVGERIRRAMHLARDGPINQAELARRMKIPNSRLGHYIQGTRLLPIRQARRMEAATGIPAAFLMGLVDEKDMELLQLPRPVRHAMLQVHASMLSKTHSPPSHAAAPFEQYPAAGKRRVR